MTELFKNKFRIESTRAEWWDYGRNGKYFITICTSNREHYFGKIVNSDMILSDIGIYVNQCWGKIPEHFPFVTLDEFVLMPNHIHGIIIFDKPIHDQNKKNQQPNFKCIHSKNIFGPQSNNLGSVIRGFKAGVTIYCKQNKYLFGWQSRYYDHIIRDDDELNRIRSYIRNNPLNWSDDEHYF